MKLHTKLSILLLAFLLAACNVDSIFLVIIDKEEDPAHTPIATLTPSPTATISPTWAPTITPTLTPTATIVPTIDPTPTQENVNRVRITQNVNIRTAPPESAIKRTAPSGSEFTVLSQRSGSGICQGTWLDIGNGDWLCFSPQWATFVQGSLGNVPVSQARAQNRIGYNINGVAIPDPTYLRQHISDYDFASMLVMDNIALACTLADEYPDSLIIHRDYSGLEESEWQKPLADWLNRWRDQGCKNVVRYSANEPGLGDLQAFVNSEIALMDAAAAEGFRVSVGNFGVGTLPDWAVEAGIFDDWLRAVVRGKHIIGAHEYTTGILPFGVGTYSRQQLLDPASMAPANWITNLPIAYIPPFVGQQVYDPVTSPFGAYEQSLVIAPVMAQSGPSCGQLPSYWHILRTTWLILRAECIGLNPADIQINLTEGLWDNLSDIDVPEIRPVQTWRNQYGIDKYFRDMRGIPSYANLWAAYYPQWNAAQAAICQLKWWDYIAPENYIGVNIFTWSTNEHWISFDVSGVQADYLYQFHDLLEQWANGADMRPTCGNYLWAA